MCRTKSEVVACHMCGTAVEQKLGRGRTRLYCKPCGKSRSRLLAAAKPKQMACLECGKSWESKVNYGRHPLHCSHECRGIAKLKRRAFPKCCSSCGVSFVAKTKNARLCSECSPKRPKGGRDLQCMQCLATFYCFPSADSKYCSRKCVFAAKRLVNTCKHCARRFYRRKFRNSDTRQYCRIQCYWDANGMDGSKAAKARSYGLCLGSVRKRCRRFGVRYDSSVTIEKVAERDGYVCQLCGRPCNTGWLVAKGKRTPHPRNRTVDHIIPLSERLHGHQWHNVQCACYSCNLKKSDNRTTDQLRLC
jgi:hypothetical protein